MPRFCHRLFRDDSDSKSGLIRYSLRKVIKHNGIIRFHAKSADRKLSSGKFEFIAYRNAIGFGIVVGEHQFIPGLDIASFRYGIKIHVLRLCMQPELRIMVFQIHILLLFQREIISCFQFFLLFFGNWFLCCKVTVFDIGFRKIIIKAEVEGMLYRLQFQKLLKIQKYSSIHSIFILTLKFPITN